MLSSLAYLCEILRPGKANHPKRGQRCLSSVKVGSNSSWSCMLGRRLVVTSVQRLGGTWCIRPYGSSSFVLASFKMGQSALPTPWDETTQLINLCQHVDLPRMTFLSCYCCGRSCSSWMCYNSSGFVEALETSSGSQNSLLSCHLVHDPMI